jgi:hypothetical protein
MTDSQEKPKSPLQEIKNKTGFDIVDQGTKIIEQVIQKNLLVHESIQTSEQSFLQESPTLENLVISCNKLAKQYSELRHLQANLTAYRQKVESDHRSIESREKSDQLPYETNLLEVQRQVEQVIQRTENTLKALVAKMLEQHRDINQILDMIQVDLSELPDSVRQTLQTATDLGLLQEKLNQPEDLKTLLQKLVNKIVNIINQGETFEAEQLVSIYKFIAEFSQLNLSKEGRNLCNYTINAYNTLLGGRFVSRDGVSISPAVKAMASIIAANTEWIWPDDLVGKARNYLEQSQSEPVQEIASRYQRQLEELLSFPNYNEIGAFGRILRNIEVDDEIPENSKAEVQNRLAEFLQSEIIEQIQITGRRIEGQPPENDDLSRIDELGQSTLVCLAWLQAISTYYRDNNEVRRRVETAREQISDGLINFLQACLERLRNIRENHPGSVRGHANEMHDSLSRFYQHLSEVEGGQDIVYPFLNELRERETKFGSYSKTTQRSQ